MLRTLTLLGILTLGACASQHPAAGCHGPIVPLNAGHWTPTAAELAAMDALCPDAKP